MEHVLTVKRELIEAYLPTAGISAKSCEEVVNIILNNHQFISRPEAEEDPSRKQIIPYVVLTRGNEIFFTRRLNKGAEKRLHGLLSLGVGGHINPEADGDGNDVLLRGMLREINEEVSIQSMGELIPRGLINDDTNEVGRVHLGLFYTVEVEGDVHVRETAKLEGDWVQKSQLLSMRESMETWSQLVCDLLCAHI